MILPFPPNISDIFENYSIHIICNNGIVKRWSGESQFVTYTLEQARQVRVARANY